MAAKKKATKATETVAYVEQIRRQSLEVYIVGDEPLLFNAMSHKVKQELLIPGERLNRAQRATTLKHDPFAEFQASVYATERKDNATYLVFPSTAFKNALRNAAVDLPGSATKAGVGRQLYVEGTNVDIFGRPQLHMTTVRQAGIARTPDVRTRACVREWCCKLRITYVIPLMNADAVTSLAMGAGVLQGIGDFRAEKGAGNYGNFRVVTKGDKEWERISKIGYAEQVDAMRNPEPFDIETERLLEHFTEEQSRRGLMSRDAAASNGRDQ